MFSLKMLNGAVLAFLATTVYASSSACPFNYPSELNSTQSGNGLVFTIISNNPVTDNRVVQLRPNIFFPGAFFAAIDNTSSVLLANLVDAGLCKSWSSREQIFCYQKMKPRISLGI